MTRSADYTIQGFLYQFNKTAFEILNANENENISIEGIVEDIEIVSPTVLTAIQCKYHEAASNFTPSMIYKPLLQMLKHFSDNPNANIEYVIFAHFPGIGSSPPTVELSTLQAALASKDKGLASIINSVSATIDLEKFLTRFRMEFGPSYDELTTAVSGKLEENGIPRAEVETLGYPNTLHMIAMLSVKHDANERKITKKQFLANLNSIRTTAISRWTLALKSRKKILEARRKQLKVQLNKNSRLRYFVVVTGSDEMSAGDLVPFVCDFIDKYHSKPAHINTPLFSISGSGISIQDLRHRLFVKDIAATDGYIGTQFEESYFFREPFTAKASNRLKREFSLRILNWDVHRSALNSRKCDDLFIIGDVDCSSIDTDDVNIEQFIGTTVKEIKFMLGMSNVYE